MQIGRRRVQIGADTILLNKKLGFPWPRLVRSLVRITREPCADLPDTDTNLGNLDKSLPHKLQISVNLDSLYISTKGMAPPSRRKARAFHRSHFKFTFYFVCSLPLPITICFPGHLCYFVAKELLKARPNRGHGLPRADGCPPTP